MFEYRPPIMVGGEGGQYGLFENHLQNGWWKGEHVSWYRDKPCW